MTFSINHIAFPIFNARMPFSKKRTINSSIHRNTLEFHIWLTQIMKRFAKKKTIANYLLIIANKNHVRLRRQGPYKIIVVFFAPIFCSQAIFVTRRKTWFNCSFSTYPEFTAWPILFKWNNYYWAAKTIKNVIFHLRQLWCARTYHKYITNTIFHFALCRQKS